MIAPDGTAYWLDGPPDAPVVAMIHGLGLCSAVFDGMAGAFTDYRILRYDLYGHGQSAPLPEEATLSLYARQLAGLLDHLAIPHAHILGFSIGGMINRRFALDFPDRVVSLVILNSPHDRGADGQAAVESRAKIVRDKGAMATMDAALKRWFTPEYLASGADGPTKVQNWRSQADVESYAQAAWVLANGVRELITPEPPISARSMVITCENDSGSTPAMSHAIADEIESAEVRIIPRLQHLGLMERPDMFTAPVLEFIHHSFGV